MSESLRDQLSANFDKVTNASIPGEGLEPGVSAEIPPPAAEVPAKADAAPVKDQPRDDKGRFAEAEKARAKAAAEAAKAPPAPAAAPAKPLEGAKPRPVRPSTWKKDHWEAFDKLAVENPALAEYINQREGEYAHGVSTYKQEWDRAKPLLDAMAPFMPLLAQHRIEPSQWISRLGNAHQTLALGTPQQNLVAFTRLAEDYQVPLQALFTQGQDGQWFLNPNAAALAQAQPQAQGIKPEDIDARINAALTQQRSEADISAFAAQKDKYPYFEEVRETMAGLLQAQLADGLEDAYAAAMGHPRHAALAAQADEQARAAQAAKDAEERRKATEAARRKAVSPRTSTPTSVAAAGEGKKDRRSVIEAAFDEHVAGRI